MISRYLKKKIKAHFLMSKEREAKVIVLNLFQVCLQAITPGQNNCKNKRKRAWLLPLDHTGALEQLTAATCAN